MEFIVDVGFILWVKAIVGSILDLISLFNFLASTCLAHAAQTSIEKKEKEEKPMRFILKEGSRKV